MPGDVLDFDLPRSPLGRATLAVVRPLLERALGLKSIRALYAGLPADAETMFVERALEALEVRIRCASEQLALVPKAGPLIVAANHPHGGIDGLVLAATLHRVRPDVRLVANHLLACIPELRALCFFVDPFRGPDAAARSCTGLRAAHLWLKSGGALVMFPAGEVAHVRDGDGVPVDPPWHPSVGRLALRTGASVVPAFIAGANSRSFYLAGRVHPLLRTGLLPREMLRKRSAHVEVRLGDSLRVGRDDPDGRGTTERLRAATCALARPSLRGRDETNVVADEGAPEPPVWRTEVSEAEREQAIDREIALLPGECRLIASGPFEVCCAPAMCIPHALEEIGRLREAAFRAVGEGTGRRVDLDRFDRHYLHLFAWDRESRRIVGAYRIGRTDQILSAQGVNGLYTRTLFEYDRRLFDRLPPALELGRSFVRPEYQRRHNALLLLWMGIGRYVATHPEYRALFGPVSISAQYSDRTHAMLIAFLEQHHRAAELGTLVRAMNPNAMRRRSSATAPGPVPRTVDEATRLVAEFEGGIRPIPVLLRQYLKLNARVLGFNVDPAFGDALDALMMVDLADVDPALLARYVGREHAARLADTRARPPEAA